MQGYVLSRVDGHVDVEALCQLTGQSRDRVTGLLHELVALGALEPDTEAPSPDRAVTEPELPALDVSPDAPEPAQPHAVDASNSATDGDPDDNADADATGTHLQLYRNTLATLTADERSALASGATEPQLTALCYDPLAPVVLALLKNPHFGLTHARLIARHHHSVAGLDGLCARAALAADAGVRRALLKNPQLPSSLFRRLWQGRRLLEQYQVTISREATEQNRRTAREVMRAHFATAPADERIELIIKTEARCLAQLTAVPLDSKTTAMLCGRTYGSTMLVQNFARWASTPPPLIAHLLRQELVKRNAMLRNALERHPNAP